MTIAAALAKRGAAHSARPQGILIRSFKDKHSHSVFEGKSTRKVPSDIQRRANMRLDRIHAATRLDDLRLPPPHNLEALKGKSKGQHAIRINAQWRVCFS